MADLRLSPPVRFEAASLERRSGVDRRSGQDRRAVDLWRETGRPGFEVRTGIDRRSGEDRRGSVRRRITVSVEFVTPWQIPEPRR